jgi:hypothetical protein
MEERMKEEDKDNVFNKLTDSLSVLLFLFNLILLHYITYNQYFTFFILFYFIFILLLLLLLLLIN